jgi:hypothetical protein
MIAALYVEPNGTYYGLDDVDPWDRERDARLYDGPHPVVAHPPCARWSPLAYLNQAQHGYQVGADQGCFQAALTAVRTWGGVLEHPAHSIAWRTFALPTPRRGGWTQSLTDPGWTTSVSQAAYGHRARKRTWLYYVGETPPFPLDWSDPAGDCIISDLWADSTQRTGRGDRPRMYQAEALATPPAFRDTLLDLARQATPFFWSDCGDTDAVDSGTPGELG